MYKILCLIKIILKMKNNQNLSVITLDNKLKFVNNVFSLAITEANARSEAKRRSFDKDGNYNGDNYIPYLNINFNTVSNEDGSVTIKIKDASITGLCQYEDTILNLKHVSDKEIKVNPRTSGVYNFREYLINQIHKLFK